LNNLFNNEQKLYVPIGVRFFWIKEKKKRAKHNDEVAN